MPNGTWGKSVKRYDIATQARRGFGLFLAIALVGAVISMLATLYLAHAGLKLGRDIAPLSQATLKVRLAVSEAHLLVEEIMGGDTSEQPEEITALYDRTDRLLTAIIKGGEIDGIAYHPTTSGFVKTEVAAAREQLQDLRLQTDKRLASLSLDQTAGSGADESFDALFDSITERLQNLAQRPGLDQSAAVQQIVGEALYQTALGHLIVEESLSGDAGEDFGAAIEAFDLAVQKLVQARRLSGVAEFDAIAADVKSFAALATERRTTAIFVSEERAAADERFDAAYEEFLAISGRAEADLRKQMDAGLAGLFWSRVIAIFAVAAVSVALVLIMLAGYRIVEARLVRRLQDVTLGMKALAAGNLDTPIPAWEANDELGDLATPWAASGMRMRSVRRWKPKRARHLNGRPPAAPLTRNASGPKWRRRPNARKQSARTLKRSGGKRRSGERLKVARLLKLPQSSRLARGVISHAACALMTRKAFSPSFAKG